MKLFSPTGVVLQPPMASFLFLVPTFDICSPVCNKAAFLLRLRTVAENQQVSNMAAWCIDSPPCGIDLCFIRGFAVVSKELPFICFSAEEAFPHDYTLLFVLRNETSRWITFELHVPLWGLTWLMIVCHVLFDNSYAFGANTRRQVITAFQQQL